MCGLQWTDDLPCLPPHVLGQAPADPDDTIKVQSGKDNGWMVDGYALCNSSPLCNESKLFSPAHSSNATAAPKAY